MARRATFIDSVRNIGDPVLVVDAGNFGDLNPTFGKLKSDFIFKMMQRMGYDAVTLGDRELSWGASHYLDLAGDETAILTSNLYTTPTGAAEPIGPRSVVREMGGVKVGVIGLIDDEVVRKATTTPEPYVAEDVYTSAERMVEELHSDDVEIVVLLAQAHISVVDSLIRRVPGIDVAVMGHRGGLRATHTTSENTIVVRPGSRGQYIGHLDLVVDPEGEIVEYGGRSVALTKTYAKDTRVQTLVNEMTAEIDRLKKEDRLRAQSDYQNQLQVDRYLGADTCARCHQPEYEQWQASAHAHAFTTLEDLGMTGSAECVSCHVTGAGDKTGFTTARSNPDLTAVQCESCHQMGTQHHIMGDKGETRLASATCTGCHDQANSPDYDPESYMEKIRHW